MKKCCLFLLIVFGTLHQIKGSESFSFKHLSIKNGLSSNQIHSIYKDYQGFMWFATDHGLVRYNGDAVKNFFPDPNDTQTLPGNQIRWIGKWIDQKILIETSNRYTIYDPSKEEFDNRIYEWLQALGIPGTPHLLRLDSKNKLWIATDSLAYSYSWKYKRLRKEIVLTSHQGNRITDFAEHKSGMAAVTNKGLLVGLYIKKGKRIQLNHLPLKDIHIPEWNYRLFTDSKGRIWKYSETGISLYPQGIKSQPVGSCRWFDEQAISFTISPYFFPRCMAEDESGRIWVGTDREGIYILDEKQKTILQLLNNAHKPYTLAGNSILSLYKDDQGIMWSGTYKSGISYYGKSLLKYHEIYYGDVTSICTGENEEIWFGTDNGRLLFRSRADSPVQEILTLPEYTPIVSLLYTRDKNLMIGTYMGGLFQYKDGKLTPFQVKGRKIHNHIWTLIEDRKGQIWIGTLGGGIQCYNPEEETITTFLSTDFPILENDYISSLFLRKDGTLLGACSTSVFIIDPVKKELQHIKGFPEFPFQSDGIHQVYEDSRKIIWIATNSGLWAVPGTRPPLFWDTRDGLPQDQIHGITEDHEGTLWISTAQGISNMQLPATGTLTKKSIKLFNYNGEENLVNSEPNLRSILTSPTNEILCGNTSGLTLFNPRQVKWGKQTPKPIFTRLSIGGQEIKVGKSYKGRTILPRRLADMKELKLLSSQNMFSLTFAPLEYNLPKKPDFMYQLEGVDKSWIMGDPQRHRISYTGFNPGKYRLKVRYLTASLEPETSTTELLIRIRPPFYHSGWAFLFYFISVGIIGWFAIVWLRHKKQIQIIEIKHKRNAEFSEMMQRFFTSISHDLRIPLTLIITPLEAILEERKSDTELHAKLSVINRNTKRLLHLVNELLDFKNSENRAHKLQLSYGDMSAFLREITDFFVDYAQEKNISFRIHTEATSYPLLFDQEKLTKAVTNLLSNAFKFTPKNGQIVLSLAENKATGETQISVIDSGIGIPIKDRPKVFTRFYQIDQLDQPIRGNGIGLNLVKEFVELHGGSVQISDGYKGTGTCFTLTLPASLRTAPAPKGNTSPEFNDKPVPVDTQKEKILIVDDNSDFVDFLAENLSELYSVRKSTNGRDAWKSILKDPPHLIISDVMMPEMDGNDLCRLVKHHRLTSHIPFILLTAKNSEESRIEGLTSGADEYQTKPFNLAYLKLRIFRFLEWSHTQSVNRPLIEPEPGKIEITSLDEEFIQNAVKYVESHIDDSDLSVNEMGKHLCVSRAQLYKRMTALTGRSPIEFIRIIRIKRAHQLLSVSKQSVAEIAYQVGFNNPKYFSRYFKEEYGISPSDFRKRQSEE